MFEGVNLVFFGPTPSVEVLSTGVEVTRVGTRAWPLVEVVDRSGEAPGSGLLSQRIVAALRAVSGNGEGSFVLTFHKMTDPLISEINARVGEGSAGLSSARTLVTVGTERDLAGLVSMSLVVASNPDGMLMGQGYRTSEETLRVLARLANSLGGGTGKRMMVQTSNPTSDLIETLRRGDPVPYLERVLIERARAGVPPSSDMIAVELRGEVPPDANDALQTVPGAAVLGPLDIDEGKRWLLEGDLGLARTELRNLAGRWREAGITVRIDADPIDF